MPVLPPIKGFIGNSLLDWPGRICCIIFLPGCNLRCPFCHAAHLVLDPNELESIPFEAVREHLESRADWIDGVVISGGEPTLCEGLFDLMRTWDTYATGLALVFVSAVAWAAFALAQKGLLRNLRSGSTMWSIYAAGCVLLLPLSTPSQIVQLDTFQLAVLIYCGLNTLIGYGCFAEALAHLVASRVSAVVATTPLITVTLMSVLAKAIPSYLAPEGLTTANFTGAALVVGGSILAALGGRRSNPQDVD